MAPINTTTSKHNIRESWHNAVSELNREETPFLSSIGTSGTGDVTKWFFAKKLNDPVENALEEGANAPDATATSTYRAANVTQIFAKTRSVTSTQEDTDTIASVDHMAQQIKDASKEMKRDIEKALTGAQGSVLDGVRKLAGVEAWLKSNNSHGTGGATAGYDDATGRVATVVDATAKREFTEELLNDAFQKIHENGGRAKTIMLGGELKRKFDKFDGFGKTVNMNASEKEIINTVDRYTGAFGSYVVKTNFIMRTSTVLLLDENTWAVAYLTKYTKKDLPSNGLYESKMIHAELTLEARDETGNGKIADVQAKPVA
ncbi:DUF5309 family protein [Rhizobium sp. Leaf262]|uniref:SU10 major capsid protein n=1 Tax=Rhizobium sp. Leaf262 TaxID=1736312 RepID=UPI0007123B41|nr:DUF5309 family protein [Rhizobium sp. Leaf262]KQO79440.1 hypothetical protein ASF29_23305 [Rhizobium sp. Leaf262]